MKLDIISKLPDSSRHLFVVLARFGLEYPSPTGAERWPSG